MKPRIQTLLIALLLLALPAVVQAQFTYTTNNGAITITHYQGSDSSVVIPATIDGYPVVSIGESAFSYTTLTNIIISDNITNIGNGAFFGSVFLTSVTIGNSVTSIGDSAFLATALTSVIIPNSVTSVGVNAFQINSLTSVTIGSGLTTNIENFSFANSLLTNITVNAANPAYSSLDGVVFDKVQTKLVSWPEGRNESYVIPNTVTNIGVDAFYGASGLTSVTIPNSVTSIGDFAFRNCYGLTNATIGNGITSIGDYAFSSCNSLTDVTIPDSVASIGRGAFSFCFGLMNVTIGNGVTNISDAAFANCTSLTSVTIPNSITSFGAAVFQGSGLTSVTIGTGVTNLEENFFGIYFGDFLTNITVDAANPVYSSLDGVLFDKAQTILIEFPIGRSGSYVIPNTVISIGNMAFRDRRYLTSVTIPNSVNSIGDQAFDQCFGLTSVTIPDSVTSIGFGAFSTCIGLTSVTIPNSVTNIGESAFSGCSGLTTLGIGNHVTSIGGAAFLACVSLTGVTIPNNVTSIGGGAFGDCSALKSVFFQGNAPPDANAFTYSVIIGYAFGKPIYGQALNNTTVYYRSGTTGWGSTFGGETAVLWNPQTHNVGIAGGHFGFGITGPTNTVIVVEACTNLANAVWIPVGTNTLSDTGNSTFTDSQSGNQPGRYYRFRSP